MTWLEAALREVTDHLMRAGGPFALICGLAVSARTEPRFTRDAVLAVAVRSDVEAEAVIRDLRRHHYGVDTVVVQIDNLPGVDVVMGLWSAFDRPMTAEAVRVGDEMRVSLKRYKWRYLRPGGAPGTEAEVRLKKSLIVNCQSRDTVPSRPAGGPGRNGYSLIAKSRANVPSRPAGRLELVADDSRACCR